MTKIIYDKDYYKISILKIGDESKVAHISTKMHAPWSSARKPIYKMVCV